MSAARRPLGNSPPHTLEEYGEARFGKRSPPPTLWADFIIEIFFNTMETKTNNPDAHSKSLRKHRSMNGLGTCFVTKCLQPRKPILTESLAKVGGDLEEL